VCGSRLIEKFAEDKKTTVSAITIALPTIEKEFNVHVGDLQWVISAYALTVR
jgi:hypothetical protein